MALKKYGRRAVRGKALQILYAYEMKKEGLDALIEGILGDIWNKNDREFGENLVNNIIANYDEIDACITKFTNNWKMERIALIDKILLRIGIGELFYFPEIPPKVSINEAIEIAKEFSTANSGKFINGVLDAVLSELKTTGKLNKVGRGVIENSLQKEIEE